MASAIHIIQRYIMSQAAARAYPGQYRRLGRTIPKTGPVDFFSDEDNGPFIQLIPVDEEDIEAW